MRLLLLIALGALAPACFLGSDPCPDREATPLRSGRYAARAMEGAGTVTTPSYENGAAKEIVVDRAAGTVRVSYTIDGRSVVETYRMGPTSSGYR